MRELTIKVTHFASALIALMLISGCSSVVTPDTAARINPQKTGLVLVTLSRSGLLEDVNDVTVNIPIHFVDGDELGPSNQSLRIGRGGKDMWLIELKPGRYLIQDWVVATSYTRRDWAKHGYEFEVKAGQVTYLGHLDFEIVALRNKAGAKLSHVSPILTDRLEATIGIFRQRYPALQAVPVHNTAPNREFTMVAAGIEFGFTTANISSQVNPESPYPSGVLPMAGPKGP